MNIVNHLRNLRRREHACTVEIVESLVTCNRERAYLDHGCSTIWDFLIRELRYSNAAASRRYKAMKCAEKFPQVIEMLREHRVSLSSLAKAESLLGEVRDPEELLERIAGKSQREVEQIITLERPVSKKPREVVRRVAVEKPEPQNDPLFTAPTEPVEQRVTVRTSLTEENYDTFERARAVISRKHPGATVEDVLNELVGFYLKKKAPRKRTKRKPRSRTRHIPIATRDAVMLRDKERCTFRSKSGRRCNATHGLQIDHIKPYALGGTHEPENLRVLCAAHNRHAARKTFGERSVPLRN
jgi:hypothetical protein